MATNIANVNSVGGSIANVNSVASNLSGVNLLQKDIELPVAQAHQMMSETSFDTTANELKVYKSSGWAAQVRPSTEQHKGINTQQPMVRQHLVVLTQVVQY